MSDARLCDGCGNPVPVARTIRLAVGVPTHHEAREDTYAYENWEVDLCLDCCARSVLDILGGYLRGLSRPSRADRGRRRCR
jgi:hypothetical protein